MSRHKTYSRVSDFVMSFIGAFEERLLGQPNAIMNREDALNQMSSLMYAKTVLPQLLQSRYEEGPFVFALTDVHRSNIFVDEHWNISRIIDLEFACSWPIEFLQPPYWLDGRCIDEIDATTFAPYHAEFLEHLKREEMIREDTANREPLSSMMQRSWIQGDFWVTLAVAEPIAFTTIFFNRILKGFFEISQDELEKADNWEIARLWRKNTCDIIHKKLKDRDRYLEELRCIFADNV
ncbi:hypothetical protein ISF_02735 [Cordyceps fumosorosea ARSEF 2679]|uniref:Aminoglycoside phosphotransferase domain-containing protein n=1 Tax=Cordyceps fumosorosea (strain ARSEF 2679) TaxID=1081104 RepID=A0A168B106_CORFA|nr:hypothetical protein ISF_02735 [Cordyceps fumosorosea ARSEF 2679]OAA69465.1 hypothetical protein ISF_02735 [Cordyceps fumosorosea ARSEF 2679]